MKLSEENTNYPFLINLTKIIYDYVNPSEEEKLEIFNKNYSRLVDKNSPFLINLSNYKYGKIIISPLFNFNLFRYY